MLKKEDMSLFIDIHYMNRHEKVENEQKIAAVSRFIPQITILNIVAWSTKVNFINKFSILL